MRWTPASLPGRTSAAMRGRSCRPPLNGAFVPHIGDRKGHLAHTKRGREFVYRPTRPRGRAGKSALRRVLSTFFDGSLEKAVAADLSDRAGDLSPEELDRLSELIRKARREDGP